MHKFFTLAAVFLFTQTASADFFKYKDAEGNLHVVEDEGLVPAEYKSKMTRQVTGMGNSIKGPVGSLAAPSGPPGAPQGQGVPTGSPGGGQMKGPNGGPPGGGQMMGQQGMEQGMRKGPGPNGMKGGMGGMPGQMGPDGKQASGRPRADVACQGKPLCGMIYVASHCPVCKALQPTHRAMLEKNSPENPYGMFMIVGFEQQPGQNEEFARALGGRYVAQDTDQSRAAKFGITTYPKYFVLDPGRAVIMKDQEASDWIQKNFGGGVPAAGTAPAAQPAGPPAALYGTSAPLPPKEGMGTLPPGVVQHPIGIQNPPPPTSTKINNP